MSITSDSDHSLTVSLKMVLAGQANQAPRRGGRQSSTQERGPGTRAPHPAPPAHPAPAATAPVTAKRSKNRGPGALLRDERRRLGQIEPGLLAHETGVEGIGAKPNLYCEAIELVCGGSPIGCGLVERKAQDRVKWEG